MFRRRYRQQIPELNTTSTADISFMLLIFFLVTSSMDTDKGLLRLMPPPPQDQQQPQDINRRQVMEVRLDAADQLSCDGTLVTPQQLTAQALSLVSTAREGHVISVKTDRATSYGAYFAMQDALTKAYSQLREQYAVRHYGKTYNACTHEQRQAINDYYPQRISEEEPEEKGGRP